MADIMWLPQAKEDMEQIDHSIRVRVFKTIEKLKLDPIAYGTPLGNQNTGELIGFYKIEPADGFRIVYTVSNKNELVVITVVGKRTDSIVYRTASKRIAATRELIKKETTAVNKLLNEIKRAET